MRVETLISTMNRESLEFINPMNLQTDAIIINQCHREDVITEEIGHNKIKMLNYKEKGLSRSRNRAIAAATADICLIADDDMRYEDDYVKKIISAYEQYPDADIIAFQVVRTGSTRLKSFRKKACQENYLSSMKISSVEMTFKRRSIIEKGLSFNPLFGAGAWFVCGEENIFMFDCLRQKLKVIYVPVIIGHVSCETSTWFTGYTPHYFKSMGAAYYAMSHTFSVTFIVQHVLRHYSLYKQDMKWYHIILNMLLGIQDYKNLLKLQNKKLKNLIIGDFTSNTGPAIVNKNIDQVMGRQNEYSVATKKWHRFLELIIKIPRANVVIFSGISLAVPIGIKWCKIWKKPSMYIMHGYLQKENSINGVVDLKFNQCEQYILAHVDKIICVSERFSTYLKQELPEYTEKITYVNNGIDWKDFEFTPISAIHGNEFRIISMGGGMKRKNNLAICKAIDLLQKRGFSTIKYIVIGNDFTDKEAISHYPFVAYIDYLPHEKILELLSTADLYIQNSYFETFGLAIVEALMRGCNLLISKNVGALSVINHCLETDIINDVEDTEEIAYKIWFNLNHPNNKRLIESINQECTSWENSCRELTKIALDLKYKGLNAYEYF